MVRKYKTKQTNNKLSGLERMRNMPEADRTPLSTETPTRTTSTTSTNKKLQSAANRLSSQLSNCLSPSNNKDESEDSKKKEEHILGDILPNPQDLDNVNLIVGMGYLLDLVNRFSCPSCRRIGKVSSRVSQRRGLLYNIVFTCECSYETSICNSSPLNNPSSSRMDELNMQACIAANVGGMKRYGMTQILGCLNILPPVQIESWNKYQAIYAKAINTVADESLEVAGKICLLAILIESRFL